MACRVTERESEVVSKVDGNIPCNVIYTSRRSISLAPADKVERCFSALVMSKFIKAVVHNMFVAAVIHLLHEHFHVL